MSGILIDDDDEMLLEREAPRGDAAKRPRDESSSSLPAATADAPLGTAAGTVVRTHGGDALEKMRLLKCGMGKVRVERNGAGAGAPKDAKLKRRDAPATTVGSATGGGARGVLAPVPPTGCSALTAAVSREERAPPLAASGPVEPLTAGSAGGSPSATSLPRTTTGPGLSSSPTAAARPAASAKKSPATPTPKTQPTITSFFAKFAAKKKDGETTQGPSSPASRESAAGR